MENKLHAKFKDRNNILKTIFLLHKKKKKKKYYKPIQKFKVRTLIITLICINIKIDKFCKY